MLNTMNQISIEEFTNLGYLQEANRRFFHPLGLGLMVERPEEGEVGSWKLAGIIDSREDEEGIMFAEGVLSREKADLVSNEFVRRSIARLKKLGYNVQPIEG